MHVFRTRIPLVTLMCLPHCASATIGHNNVPFAGEGLSSVCRGGFRGGGWGVQGVWTPLSYMKNDVMLKNDVVHTVIYAAFCMLPSLDLQACTLF